MSITIQQLKEIATNASTLASKPDYVIEAYLQKAERSKHLDVLLPEDDEVRELLGDELLTPNQKGTYALKIVRIGKITRWFRNRALRKKIKNVLCKVYRELGQHTTIEAILEKAIPLLLAMLGVASLPAALVAVLVGVLASMIKDGLDKACD